MTTTLEMLNYHAERLGIPLRTKDQVLATLAQCRKKKSDMSMARLMLKAGRLTDEAREAVQNYINAGS